MLRIINGQVYDPVNGISGETRDIYIRDKKIFAGSVSPDIETIDAKGCVIMPGGVEIHSHVAGAKVNNGRILCPEDSADHYRIHTETARSGCSGIVPTTFMTGYEYARLGYTTLFEAAVPPLKARHAHEELRDTPLMDTGCYTVMGNNYLVMKALRDQDQQSKREKLRGVVSWLLNSTKGYAVKIVNPGGVENWKWNRVAIDLDTPVPPFDVTPRMIMTELARVTDEMKLPHSIHLHTNHLGEPGNMAYTLETMKALSGYRAHFTHLQFHSYDKSKKGGFASGARTIAEYFNSHPEFTCDAGMIVFGPTMTMTADAPMAFSLHQMRGGKWSNMDIEMETGSGVVPIKYQPGVLANAVQWCVGLELMLLIDDPWRVFLSTDHPNAGHFTSYPLLIRLLMDRDYRLSWFEKLHPKVREYTCLHELTREYTLEEIAIITRCGPAKALGLKNKGHLGEGADADAAIYPVCKDKQVMFSSVKYLIKDGNIVFRDGVIKESYSGRAIGLDIREKAGLSPDLKEYFEQYSTVAFANYKVEEEYTPGAELVRCG